LPLAIKILTDEDEWQKWEIKEVLHIQLRNWADIFLISPLDANTLGKLAAGICDNLLTCVARAWNLLSKPIVICPAMNTQMWLHPVTQESLEKLKSWGYIVIPPISKKLACGDYGVGGMETVEVIASKINHFLK